MCVMLGAAAGAGAMGGAMSGVMTAVTSIAGIGMSIMQANAQNQAAAAQYKNQVEYIKRQEVQTQKTLNQQVAQQQMQNQSDTEKLQGEKADTSIKAYKAASRASAAAAESGVVGLSVDNLIGDIWGEAGRYNAKVDHAAKVGRTQAQMNLKGQQRGGAARIASMEIPVKPKFNTGLQIGTAVLGGIQGLAGAF